MRSKIILLFAIFSTINVFGQWNVNEDPVLYRKNDGENIIIKTSRTDNTQAGLFRSDGWGNFSFNKDLGIGGRLFFYGDQDKVLLKTSRTDDTQVGAISTNGWGSFKFSKDIIVNNNVYVGQKQAKGQLILRSGNYQRDIQLEAYNSYTENEYTQGLKISPNRIINVSLHNMTDSPQEFTVLSASRTDGTFYNKLIVHKVYDYTHSHDLCFTNNGNVGIGTTIPKARLDVAGTIRATEIKVEAQTADFVFDENYSLRSLDEVEDFIKTNGHLPSIPSAESMEKNGVNLAEMNKLLLQKIEELTLYAIEQEGKLKEKDRVVEDLRSEIKELKEINRNTIDRLAKIEAFLIDNKQ
jgi:hypothetical protein